MTDLICGIDIGTKNTGLVLLDLKGNIYRLFLISSDKKDVNERIKIIAKEVDEILGRYKPQLVIVEKTIMIQNFITSSVLTELLGIFRWLCIEYELNFDTVPNKTWKKHVSGNGNAKKEDTLAEAKRLWPSGNFESNDVSDAACIAKYGLLKFQGKL